MGYMVRVKQYKEQPITKKEIALNQLRHTMREWERRRLGLSAPATAEKRFALGDKIRAAKLDLVESGLYVEACSLETRILK